MGDKPGLTSADKQGIIAKLTNFISRACQIPPRPRIRFLSSSPRLSPPVKFFTVIFFSVVFLVCFINFGIPTLAAIYPDGPRLPEVIDVDFLLTPRKPILVDRPNLDFFYMEGSDELVIRDCTVYTLDWYAPRNMRKYDDTTGIIVKDSAHLTLINVTFIPSASIKVSDNASVKMVNVTNYRTIWATTSGTWLWGRGHGGSITAIESATIRVEGSKTGVLTISSGSYVDCIVTNSYLERASLANEVPPRFVDSEVYEMIDHVGNVALDGTEIGNGSRMALTVRSSLNKSTIKRGEPISATFSLENVGNLTLYFPKNNTDKFIMSYDGSNVWNQTYPYDEPTPPEYHFPAKLEPGHVFVQTLTWQNPPFQPRTYWIRCDFYFKSISESIGNEQSGYLFGFCGGYTITISEEDWQG